MRKNENLENKYELIINLNAETKKVYEKYFKDEGYQILVNEENLIFAKKVNNPDNEFKNEKELIDFAINMAKRQNVAGVLYINLDKEMNAILNKVGNLEKVDFKSNFISWQIRQEILKSIIKRYRNKENT